MSILALTYLVRVEYEVKLAHILEAAVEDLHEHLYQIEDRQLRLCLIDHEHEHQSRI